MVSVNDVASYILKLHGPISAMKLQKLVYYCQAWSLVWDERPLFKAKIEAWVNGPVVPVLYRLCKGQFHITAWPYGDASKITGGQKETIRSVIDFYGNRTAQWLSDLTHSEKPWMDARAGLADDERGENEITIAALHEYYSGL